MQGSRCSCEVVGRLVKHASTIFTRGELEVEIGEDQRCSDANLDQAQILANTRVFSCDACQIQGNWGPNSRNQSHTCAPWHECRLIEDQIRPCGEALGDPLSGANEVSGICTRKLVSDVAPGVTAVVIRRGAGHALTSK